jgi:transposase
MFTDEQRRSVWDRIRQLDLRAFDAILGGDVLAKAAEEAGVGVGGGPLNLTTLAWLAVSAALRPGVCFAKVLSVTFRLLQDMERLPAPRPGPGAKGGRGKRGKRSQHDPRRPAATCPSEEAFAQARGAMPDRYWVALFLVLGRVFESRHADRLRYKGLRLLALDGTCLSLQRWKPLGEHFGCARNGSGTPRPQARMVMLLLAGVRLPWRYELTPRSQGESTVAARLLAGVRADDLVLMDRGFFNFGLFRQVQEAGAFFAVRRVKRLRLRTVRRLGPHDRLARWKPAARKWGAAGKAGIVLRVIDYQVRGFRKTAIVTNLLDEARVSRAEFTGLEASDAWVTERDAALYHRRWQIETAFAEMKAVQRMEGGLRGRTPAAVRYEVAGHVLLHLLTRWLIAEAAQRHGKDPLALSFTNALCELRRLAGHLPACPRRLATRLVDRLLSDIAACTVPPRPGRHYPRPKDGKRRRTGAGHRITSSKLEPCRA